MSIRKTTWQAYESVPLYSSWNSLNPHSCRILYFIFYNLEWRWHCGRCIDRYIFAASHAGEQIYRSLKQIYCQTEQRMDLYLVYEQGELYNVRQAARCWSPYYVIQALLSSPYIATQGMLTWTLISSKRTHQSITDHSVIAREANRGRSKCFILPWAPRPGGADSTIRRTEILPT